MGLYPIIFVSMMAWYYVNNTSDANILMQEINGMSLIERLEIAFKVPPAGSNQLAQLLRLQNKPNKVLIYHNIALTIRNAIPEVFMDNRGMLKASTEKSQQCDVWSTSLAVCLGVLDTELMEKSCKILAQSYKEGSLAFKGNIRHILTTDDFNKITSWEYSYSKKNTYQNGAYWGTPTYLHRVYHSEHTKHISTESFIGNLISGFITYPHIPKRSLLKLAALDQSMALAF